MAIGMGIYQGVNPSMGWLLAVGNGLQTHSNRAVTNTVWKVAFGHFLSMAGLMIPIGLVLLLVVAVLDMPKTAFFHILLWWNVLLVVFGGYKLLVSRHPRFISRIPSNSPLKWSFFMSMTHCGSWLMMTPMAIHLFMHNSAPGMEISTASLLSFTLLYALVTIVISLLMGIPLFLVSLSIAHKVYNKLGLRALGKYWINFDIGWALMFIIMGVIGLMKNPYMEIISSPGYVLILALISLTVARPLKRLGGFVVSRYQ